MRKRSLSIHPLDIAIIAAGVVAVVFSFFDYYEVSVLHEADSTTAWHGFFGWFGTVLAAAGAVVVGVAPFVSARRLRVSPAAIAAALFALGAASTVEALFTTGFDPGRRPLGAPPIHSGHGYAYWVSLAVIVAGAVLAAIRALRISGPGGPLRRGSGTLGFENEPTEPRGQ
jgi:hypothetical protein